MIEFLDNARSRVRIHPVTGLAGRVNLPGDKSIAHRIAIFSALAEGTSKIVGYPIDAADPLSTLKALTSLGIEWEINDEEDLLIHGRGLDGLRAPDNPIDCGNSGTTMRLLAGVLAGQSFESTLIGDDSLSRRPMRRIVEPLTRMGADISLNGEHAPIHIRPAQLKGTEATVEVASAQVKSAVLLAGLFAEGTTTVIEPAPTRDHTERLLELESFSTGGVRYITISPEPIRPRSWIIPRDFSAAAFFLAASCIVPESMILLPGVGLNPTRTAFLECLQLMGANIQISNHREYHNEPIGDMRAESPKARLQSVNISGSIVPNLIDEIPTLAVIAAFAEGTTIIHDAAELRRKECDRISATVGFLKAMGVTIEEHHDGMTIHGGMALQGTDINSFADHRIAMAGAVAALAASGSSTILNADCVDVSFPEFWSELRELA